jgi:thiamine kinase-like enzyme
VKIPIGSFAAQNILREADILERLATEKPGLTPSLVLVDKKNGTSVQDFVDGRQTGTKLTEAHMKWLSALRIPGEKTSLSEQAERLALRLDSQTSMDKETLSLLSVLLDRMKDQTPLQAVWLHGDFAPWNLKWVTKKKLVAFDWEFAQAYALPGLDLVHYICQEKSNRYSDIASIDKLESSVIRELSKWDIPYLPGHIKVDDIWCFYLAWYQVLLSELQITGSYRDNLMAIIRGRVDGTF